MLGNNDTTGAQYFTPISVSGVNKTFCKISTSGFCVLAIDKNGRAWGWGANNYGQIGDNSYSEKYTPVSVAGAIKTFCQINAGYYHSMAVDKNGRAWAWGFDPYNQLGTNRIYSYKTPVSITGAIKTFCKIFASTNFNSIFAGANRACALDKNGMIWSWGTNGENGGLGDNTNNNVAITPISVVGTLKTFCQISIGVYGASSAVDKNGRAWCWGLNSIGQLGDGTLVSRLTPVSVIGPNRTFCQISTGVDHTAALDKNGMVWSWGGNRWGAIGNNTITCYCSPVAVGGATKTFCHISAGGRYTAAIDKYGKVWTWGNNYTSQLGDGTTVSKLTPINIAGATKTFCKISAGIGAPASRFGAFSTALAIDKYGMIWGWGAAGAIGDNASIQRSTPVSIVGTTKTFCQVSSGYGVSCAIDKNGRAWCWGNNTYGQLGDDSITCRLTPVSVAGAIKTFCQIAAGYNQSYGIDKYGRAWSWGHIGNGALGNGTDFRSVTPVKVCNI